MTTAGRIHNQAARNSSDTPGWHALHRQVEDEIATAFEYGFLCGLDAASAAVDRALREAVAGVHHSAKEVVGQLIRAMDREIARSRYE